MILQARNLEIKALKEGQKITAIEAILNKQTDTLRRHLLKQLSATLLNSDSYLIQLPAEISASLIICLLNFLEQSDQEPGIKTLGMSSNGEPLLLLHCRTNPYIVDSLMALQQSNEIPFQLLAYPVFSVKRHENKLLSLESNGRSGNREILVIIRLEMQTQSDNNLDGYIQKFRELIDATQKIEKNRLALTAKLYELKKIPGLTEQEDFIDWLVDNAFTIFSYQTYLNGDLTPQSHLGMPVSLAKRLALKSEFAAILGRKTTVIVQTIPIKSNLVRNEHLIYIGFREVKVGGTHLEHGFIGLFNNIELNGAACQVPALCHKIAELLNQMNIPKDTHERLQLREIFNLFPKIELFLLDETQLVLITHSLRHYCVRPNKIKCLILASTAPSRISALIILPTALFRADVESVLQHAICTELLCTLEASRKIIIGGQFVGLQMTLLTSAVQQHIDVDALDNRLNKLAKPWLGKFRQIAQRLLGRPEGYSLWQKYQFVFPIDYQTLMPARYAVRDMLKIEQLLATKSETIELLNPCQKIKNYRLHFYSLQERFLDEYIQVLENLHLRLLDQVQFTVSVEGVDVFIKSFTVRATHTQYASFSTLKHRLLDMMQGIFKGKTENDTLNSLLMLSGLAWQEIDVLRAYRNYYLQLGYQTRIASFNHALLENPLVALQLYRYFAARFTPNPDWDDLLNREEQALFPVRAKLSQAIEGVSDINDDRILRTLFNLIDATVRTNYFVRRELDDYFIAIKINSLGVIDMPAPRPQHEIYVHAVDMEGIHLRGGNVSRGGLRWSDRPDDFRTEILGLMQTQMSKNALIVPSGAKGGFVVKSKSSGVDFKEAGKKAYVTLIQGLLDLTDNVVQDQRIAPPGLVIYDDHDPYLVVAADKGTAQFPDLANSVAADYQFWLADAFASGGSKGYNHKQLGITAKGAWECVKRHFRELAKDIQSQPFTVVGVGSMDGDVFGNGMLLSPYIQLRAAISGQHIFIDPNPENTEQALIERQRLFDLPGSSWDDYQRELISDGGGVFRRDAKSIPVSQALKDWLNIRHWSLDAESLIRYLLCADVELLWFGGIGTYVKASTEDNDAAGDRANDNVRVDATEIKARVVGEGANLGFTQKARIEYSLANGHINTDAIDNSAGVDISDHEVNLKIFLGLLQKQQIIADYQPLFMQISSDVCASVLANNYAQSLCLSLDTLRCLENTAPFMQVAEYLEDSGFLDRELESFPQMKTVNNRPGMVLSRPELAVLMASCKIQLKQSILEQSAFLDNDIYDYYLRAYFPKQVLESYQNELCKHPLANQIKATLISSYIVNQAGCGFLNIGKENNTILEAVSCYLGFDRVFGGTAFRQAVYALDNQITSDLQYELLLAMEKGLAEICQWYQDHQKLFSLTAENLENLSVQFKEFEHYYAQNYEQNQDLTKRITDLQYSGVPEVLACRAIILEKLEDFPMLVGIAKDTSRSMIALLELFETTKQFLGLTGILKRLSRLSQQDYWERKVTIEVREEIRQSITHLVTAMLGQDKSCIDFFNEPNRSENLTDYQMIQQQIIHNEVVSLLPFVALSKALNKLSMN